MRKIRVFTLLVLALVFTWLISPSGLSWSLASGIQQVSPEDKIEPGLRESVVAEGKGAYWIDLVEQADLDRAYFISDWDARGEFVWSQEGRIDPESLTVAMDRHFLEGPAAQGVPLHLTVRPGDRALDPATELSRHPLGLGRFRGREVVLSFWQSWSAPCIRELRRLQRLHDEERGRGPVILAVNGGEEP